MCSAPTLGAPAGAPPARHAFAWRHACPRCLRAFVPPSRLAQGCTCVRVSLKGPASLPRLQGIFEVDPNLQAYEEHWRYRWASPTPPSTFTCRGATAARLRERADEACSTPLRGLCRQCPPCAAPPAEAGPVNCHVPGPVCGRHCMLPMLFPASPFPQGWLCQGSARRYRTGLRVRYWHVAPPLPFPPILQMGPVPRHQGLHPAERGQPCRLCARVPALRHRARGREPAKRVPLAARAGEPRACTLWLSVRAAGAAGCCRGQRWFSGPPWASKALATTLCVCVCVWKGGAPRVRGRPSCHVVGNLPLRRWSRGRRVLPTLRPPPMPAICVQGATVYREWAPGAAEAQLIGDFNGWQGTAMERDDFGTWTLRLPDGAARPAADAPATGPAPGAGAGRRRSLHAAPTP